MGTEGDAPPVVSFGGVGCVGSGMVLVRLRDEGVYQVHHAACGLVGSARAEILFILKTLAQSVILRLRHPLQEDLQMLPCRMGPELLEPAHLLQGGVVGQRGGR